MATSGDIPMAITEDFYMARDTACRRSARSPLGGASLKPGYDAYCHYVRRGLGHPFLVSGSAPVSPLGAEN
jgi:hypothetical protein